MADETLKRLLNAEMEAERIVTRADEERQAIIEQAKRDARAEQQQYADRIADLRASFRAQAEQRAQQTITAMQRRFQEQELALRSSAKLHEQLAIDEGLAVITGTQK
jgi:vacuolar-type H+-ATPase subunit H